jgi:hypothetical protein
MSASRPSLSNLKTVTLSGSGFSQVSANVVSVTNALQSSNVITSTSTITGGNLVTAGNLEVGGSANIADLLRANNGIYVPVEKSSSIGDLTAKATTLDSLVVTGFANISSGQVQGNLQVGNIILDGQIISTSGAQFGNIEAQSLTVGTIKVYQDAEIGGNLRVDGNLAAGNIVSYHLVDAETGTFANLSVSATATVYDLIITNSIVAPESNVTSVTAETARAGYGAIGGGLERGRQLSSIYQQPDYNQAVAEEELFKLAGQTQAGEKRKKIIGLEKATFGGQTGVSSGALSQNRSGSY